jgi:HPt (histidine-containing phosphotransfer) domain-containing protein
MATQDVEFLLDLVGGDRPAARDILRFFVESDTNDRAALAAAIAAKNANDIRLHSHRIKGAAKAIGATAHAAHAYAIELASASGGDLTAAFSTLEASSRDVAAWTWDLQ